MKKKIFLVSFIFLLIVPGAVSASYISYTGYSLPPLQQNNYTGYHEKQTNNDYIENIVENLSNTDTVNFWAENSSGAISKKYNQKIGSYAKINFDVDMIAGQDVRMGMENAHWYWREYAFVAGRVDFN